MPKSKRATVVHLSKTSKKTKQVKAKLIEQVKINCEQFHFAWLFRIEHVRNSFLQDIRSTWKPSKIFMGRNAIMRIGLGSSDQNEHMPGTAALGRLLEGNTGLLFTNEPPKVVLEWFDDYVRSDYARKGNVATETVELPEGPVMIQEVNDEPSVAPGSLETHFRSLGLPTSLQRGVPTLSASHLVCREGEKLDTNKASLLKALGYQMAQCKVILSHVWIKDQSKTLSAEDIRSALNT